MRKKTVELDVDFIGGQSSLTKDEERAISEYIKTQKTLKARKHPGKNKGLRIGTSLRKKVVA